MRFERPHKLIGLTGRAGSGKDTVARLLVSKHWRPSDTTCAPRVLAFADPIRQMLLAMGLPAQHICSRELKEEPWPLIGRSYRELAQTLGTEWGRHLVAPDLWVRLMEQLLLADLDTARTLGRALLTIITDVRMPNEAEAVHAWGGVIVRVERPGIEPVRDHSSEHSVDAIPADHTLHNDGDLIELRERVRTLADTLGLLDNEAAA